MFGGGASRTPPAHVRAAVEALASHMGELVGCALRVLRAHEVGASANVAGAEQAAKMLSALAMESKVQVYLQPFCGDIIACCINVFVNHSAARGLKLTALSTLSDMSMAGNFAEHAGAMMSAVQQAAGVRRPPNASDATHEFISSLRAGVTEAYASIAQGLRARRCVLAHLMRSHRHVVFGQPLRAWGMEGGFNPWD